MSLFLLLGIPILFLVLGYFLWQNAYDNYGYNIFGIGVLIRFFIALAVCFFDITFGIILFIIFSIWNFIATYSNTSFLVALLSVIFQPVALLFAISAINRLIKEKINSNTYLK